MAKNLSMKQKKFCLSYFTHGKRIQAIYEAGYSVSSKKVAAQLAYKLMNNPHILQELEALGKRLDPDLPGTIADLLYKTMTDESGKPMVRLKAVTMISKIMGWMPGR